LKEVVMATITYDEVHKLFNYDPEIGIFTNKIPRGSSAKKGAFAGSLNGDGYLNIQVNGKSYKASRLAWLYVFGYFPENQIDHINRIRTDNRIENLREVSPLLGSRSGLSTIEESLGDVADKIAELVTS